MDDPFRCALVIEVGNLLAENEAFKKCRTSLARAQRVRIVRNRESLFGCKWCVRGGRVLVCFASADLDLFEFGSRCRCINRLLRLPFSIFLVREFFQETELLSSKLPPIGGWRAS
jgi:hypothetical protein